MNLILKEYLSLLKESGELDRLLPDLLLAMNIRPISRPQIGVRQHGVDVAAIGRDEDTGTKTLFLFVIKQSDLTRNDWDGNPQAIRPSLEEVKDVYIPTHIAPENMSLPIKIVLCSGGGIEQSVVPNWTGYTSENTISSSRMYEFWGGDKLALLISRFLLNERIFPKELQSSLRKALALITDTDYECLDFYGICSELTYLTELGDFTKQSTRKKLLKSLKTLNICTNILCAWAIDGDNLKNALLCTERAVLNSWQVIAQNGLESRPTINEAFNQIYITLESIYNLYFEKALPYTAVKSGFLGYSRFSIIEGLSAFDHLGHLGLSCLLATDLSRKLGRPEYVVPHVEALCNYVNNHEALNAPLYDSHIIELLLAFDVLLQNNQTEFVKDWISNIANQATFAYKAMGHHFPICSDSFEDLLGTAITGDKDKTELIEVSTLFAAILQLCIAQNWREEYDFIRGLMKEIPECTLQVWYPDASTDEALYIENAGYTSGNTMAPLTYEADIAEMRSRMIAFKNDKYRSPEMRITSIDSGWELLPMIASRHFRTPVLPYYWEKHL